MTSAANSKGRIAALDLARGVALLGMAIFHLAYDLQLFGYLAPGTTTTGAWAIYARLVAGSFLFLVGVGLYLGHGQGIRWPAFWRRLLKVAAAAALVTLATYLALAEGVVFFGILHSIAVTSLIGLVFLRLPSAVTLLVAVAVLAAPHYLRTGAFDSPWLWWVGLTSYGIGAVDYVPVLPWLAPVLFGIVAARAGVAAGLTGRLSRYGPEAPRGLRVLTWPGRHSLLVYLVHQPVLLTLVWAATRLAG